MDHSIWTLEEINQVTPPRSGRRSVRSCRKRRTAACLCPPHLHRCLQSGIRLQCDVPPYPAPPASYAVAVRRASALLRASFRPRLATILQLEDLSLALPPDRCARDFHPRVVRHAGRTRRASGVAICRRLHPACSMIPHRRPVDGHWVTFVGSAVSSRSWPAMCCHLPRDHLGAIRLHRHSFWSGQWARPRSCLPAVPYSE